MKSKLPNISGKIQRVKPSSIIGMKSRINNDLHNLNRSSFLNLDSTGFRIKQQAHVNETPMLKRLHQANRRFNENRVKILEGFKQKMNDTFLCNSANLESFYKDKSNDLDFYDLIDIYKNYFISILLYNHDPLMLQLNLFAFSSGYNKHSLHIILDKFCSLIERLNLPDHDSLNESEPANDEPANDEPADVEAHEQVKTGVKCDHCETCDVCDNWLCGDCLSGSGLSSKFYCNIYQENFIS